VSKNTVKKSATRPGRNGGTLKVGNPGNKGGTGRPPNEWKAQMERLADRARQALEASRVLDNTEHPLYLHAAKWVQENAHGKPAQTLEHTGKDGGAIELRVVYEDDDA
jgi:hypothetical protein